MALSKEYVIPVRPNNIYDLLEYGICDHSDFSDGINEDPFTPGFLVYKNANGNLVRVNESHEGVPVYVVWTDGNRSDTDVTTYDVSGGTLTTAKRYALLRCTGIECDFASTLFTDTPVVGDLIVKADAGATPAKDGKLTPVTDNELNILVAALGCNTASILLGKVVQPSSRTFNGVTYHRVLLNA